MRSDSVLYRDCLVAGLLSASLLACGGESNVRSTTPADPPPAAVTADNNSWVSLSGTIVATRPDAFDLDYGEGVITVEMDDHDWFDESAGLLVDDQVVVYGYVDDDFYEKRTIEASSVYVRGLGTQFYASGVDEEDLPTSPMVTPRAEINLSGEVDSIAGRHFFLETDAGVIEVETSQLGYNPLDDEGYQKIDVGDRVRVRGQLASSLFSGHDLVATDIISLEDSS